MRLKPASQPVDPPLEVLRLARAQHHRPDPMRITNAQQAVPADQGQGRKRPAAAPVNRVHRTEDVPGLEMGRILVLQFVRENVEQQFGIRFGVDVAPVAVEQLLRQALRVDQIAIVAERDSVWGIDVKRLGLGGIIRSRRRVPHMTDARITVERRHVSGFEDVPDQAAAFVQPEFRPVQRCDAGGILPAVLEHGQRVVQSRRYRTLSDDPYYSAHGACPRETGSFSDARNSTMAPVTVPRRPSPCGFMPRSTALPVGVRAPAAPTRTARTRDIPRSTRAAARPSIPPLAASAEWFATPSTRDLPAMA